MARSLVRARQRAEDGAEESVHGRLVGEDASVRQKRRPAPAAPVRMDAVENGHRRPERQVLGLRGREPLLASPGRRRVRRRRRTPRRWRGAPPSPTPLPARAVRGEDAAEQAHVGVARRRAEEPSRPPARPPPRRPRPTIPASAPRSTVEAYPPPVDTLGLDAQRRLTLAATILGSSLAFIDATVVIVALPTIEEDLGLGLTGQQWVFLSYSLALASLYLVGGAIGDRYGRRRVFIAGRGGLRARLAPRRRRAERGACCIARPHAAGRRRRVPDDELARAPAGRLRRRTRGARSGSGPPSRASPRSSGRRPAARSSSGRRGAGSSSSTCRSRRLRSSSRSPAAGRMRRPSAQAGSTSRGRRSPRRASASLTYGLVEGADRGFGERLVGLRPRRRLARRVRRSSSSGVAHPMLPFALFRRAELRRCQRGDVPRLRRRCTGSSSSSRSTCSSSASRPSRPGCSTSRRASS